uniref:Uncharacterized protein n=1 Tax=Romanomermis culicivorax TaxID=13658 RepID=A0A915L7J2_ROMCU
SSSEDEEDQIELEDINIGNKLFFVLSTSGLTGNRIIGIYIKMKRISPPKLNIAAEPVIDSQKSLVCTNNDYLPEQLKIEIFPDYFHKIFLRVLG